MNTLSKARPRPSILIEMSLDFNTSVKSLLVNCAPWSLLNISGEAYCKAFSKAEMQKELSNELSEKLGTLCKINQKHLQMFIMHKVYGKTHREIAEIYRVTERTSVTTVKRVLNKLRKCLGLK